MERSFYLVPIVEEDIDDGWDTVELYGVKLVSVERTGGGDNGWIHTRFDKTFVEPRHWDTYLKPAVESFATFCYTIRRQQMALYLCLHKQTVLPKDVIKMIVKCVDDQAVYTGPCLGESITKPTLRAPTSFVDVLLSSPPPRNTLNIFLILILYALASYWFAWFMLSNKD